MTNSIRVEADNARTYLHFKPLMEELADKLHHALITPMAKAMLAIASTRAVCFVAVSLTTRAIRGESTPSSSMTGCTRGRVGGKSQENRALLKP